FCVAVLSSALPFSLDLFALKEIPSKVFSVLQSLQPAFAALSGLIFLRELLSPTQWLAIMFVIMASMGAALSHD
ncbi:MAG: EamA family transporter, partial [Thermoguttaceae bacterium]|nr:EamA family transporter [Thermoguttaceae bacterium]